jgi:hypothetical protein
MIEITVTIVQTQTMSGDHSVDPLPRDDWERAGIRLSALGQGVGNQCHNKREPGIFPNDVAKQFQKYHIPICFMNLLFCCWKNDF